MNNKKMVFWFSILVMLGLAGCGTSNTPTPEQITQGNTAEIIETSAPIWEETPIDTSDVEVIDLTSAKVAFDFRSGRLYEGGDAVTATLSIAKDGTIKVVNLDLESDNPKSEHFQSAFEAALPAKLIGQNISDASVGKLGGASYSSKAFAAALTDI